MITYKRQQAQGANGAAVNPTDPFDPRGNPWAPAGCAPCTFIACLDPLVVLLAFFAGRVVGRESGAMHFTDNKAHRRRMWLAIVALALLIFFLLSANVFTMALGIFVIIAFSIGFMTGRSQVNFDRRNTKFNINYNTW